MTSIDASMYRDGVSRAAEESGLAILAACVVLAAVTAPIVAFAGAFALAAASAIAAILIASIVLRPELGAYAYLIATPLVVGIARDNVLPVLRPNEALLAVILVALGLRVLFTMVQGKPYRPSMNGVDLAFIVLALCASVLPSVLRWARREPISTDDILYAIVLWKYYAVYRIFRETVTTETQVAVCLWLSMASAIVVAIVAILQVNNLIGVPEFLFAYFDNPFDATSRVVTDRGTSTIASSFGVADTMIMNLGIVIVMLSRGHPKWRTLSICGVMFVFGCLAAGQFSGYIGLGTMVVIVGVLTGRLRQTLIVTVPLACAAAALLWPVLAERLSGFESLAGLPESWLGRWENLERFFFKDLWSGLNWLTGVRPSARIAAPEPWRQWVYIESGYLWLLWTGGVPLVAAFVLFIWTIQRYLLETIRVRRDATSVAAIVSLAWAVTLSLLMVLDPHLTMRGAADLFYPLVALSLVGVTSQGIVDQKRLKRRLASQDRAAS